MAECKCFEEWRKLLKENYEENNPGKIVEKVEVTPKALVFNRKANKTILATCSYGELTLQGRKKPINVTLNHTYCPFCGEKYDYRNEEEEPAEEQKEAETVKQGE